MNHRILIGSLIAAPLVLAISSGYAGSVDDGCCANIWLHEPLIVYDVSGATFAGPTDLLLTVYTSGQVKISSASLLPRGGRADITTIPPDEARDLAVDLRSLGAYVLCDFPSSSADIPLKTLTVFGGGSETIARTFSWFEVEGSTALIQQLLAEFIADTFPDF